jgi:hypothetical protein
MKIGTARVGAAMLGILVGALSLPAAAAIVTTAVATYDEQVVSTNQPDIIASTAVSNPARVIDTVAEYAAFKTRVAVAYAAGMGGVLNFDDAHNQRGLDLQGNYASGAKAVLMNLSAGPLDDSNPTSPYVLPNADPPGQTISGLRILGKSYLPDMHFEILSIAGGLPSEAVVAFGISILDFDTQNNTVVGTAYFNDGSTASVQSLMNGGLTDQDTFFGFVAPAGLAIREVTLTGLSYRHADDLGFITAIVPEPATLLCAGALGALLLGRRQRRQRPPA